MYIPEFLCGVVATIGVEIAIAIIVTLVVNYKDDKRRKNR